MNKKITIDPLSVSSIQNAIDEMHRQKARIARKEKELLQRLSLLGATVASVQFSRAVYNGVNDVTVRVDNTGSVAVIYAEGEAVAFIEFGSGAKYGYGYPDAAKLGVGPGTYPDGKGHWNDPKGWWYGHGQHSFGNPPAMAMYQAREQIAEAITEIARQVFASD